MVVFHEVVLDSGVAGVREEPFPVDGTLADVGHAATKLDGLAHRTLLSIRRRSVLHPVLYVNERETAGIFFEVCPRILAGDAAPAEIHFHGDEFRIRFGERDIAGEFAADWIRG